MLFVKNCPVVLAEYTPVQITILATDYACLCVHVCKKNEPALGVGFELTNVFVLYRQINCLLKQLMTCIGKDI